jgi:hypothetical protein
MFGVPARPQPVVDDVAVQRALGHIGDALSAVRSAATTAPVTVAELERAAGQLDDARIQLRRLVRVDEA